MTNPEPARSRAQRRTDALDRLAGDRDAWVATASADGMPTLVPLWFLWDRGRLLMCTRRNTPTARNLTPRGEAVVTVGHATDVVHIAGAAEVEECDALPPGSGDAFSAKLGWDPRGGAQWVFVRITPHTVKAWREDNEQPGRLLMREGRWLD
ncbi:pyridoxamine 5'-phosphate oxidase family protein [Streptomyces sp. WMMC940]|uniref:pyridoxamine 5'-phosphate oxidase family protein n=1 Tax=Streptomyces sp. WMMC940 TaxID=3015153 RepID=UPI0022B629A1|nr:pyridoxamine 5'-phosphate oxidase family protein [Streptomyces sp. WMMC940]MCZ7460316.1 pyridoxamine 5'-phosphate oxidase family protein [Streptomyces sp. WMMC940]